MRNLSTLVFAIVSKGFLSVKVLMAIFGIVCILFTPFATSAQVDLPVWGGASGVDVANSQFANPFVNATTYAPGDNVSAWTSLSIFDANGTPGAAFWTRSLTAVSNGGYATGLVPSPFPSRSNGVAIFDSDFMDTNGISGNFGGGPSPAAHRGELISPRIDLTGHANRGLILKFYTHFRQLNISLLGTSISTDDGATWSTPVDFRQSQSVNTMFYDSVVVVNNTILQGVADLSQCRIKFIFQGEYYFAIVDDVTLFVPCPGNNTSSVASSAPTLCVNTPLTAMTHATTGATGIGTPTGLPDGVTATWSSNTITISGTPTASGRFSYSIPLTGGCGTAVNATGTITVNSPAMGTDTRTACGSYRWIDGNTYTASNSTATFNIVGGAANGCDSLVTLDLTINSPATGTDTRTVCGSYRWIDGNTYTASNSTATFNIVGGAANGCDSLVTLNLTINTVDATVNNNAPELTANAIGATYQWIDCNNGNAPINGQTNVSFNATSNGSYAVIVARNGCVDTSACIVVTNVGLVENSFGNPIVVFPNPTTGNVTINFGGNDNIESLIVKNILGQVIYTSAISEESARSVAIEGETGVYFIELFNTKGNRAVIKILKQ